MSRKVLVAYATKMGSTAGIAQAVGTELQRCGHGVEVRNIRDVGSIAEYGTVIVGSAVYLRRWRSEAVHFLRRHAKESGRLDPTSARGFVARRLARGDLAGDFRDWDQITQWARGLSDAISSVEVSSWTWPDDPQHNNPEGVAP